MRNMQKKIIGLAVMFFVCTTLTIGTSAAIITNPVQNVIATFDPVDYNDYGWVCTHDGVGVNFRSSASTSSTILAKIPEGTKVYIYSILSTGWYKVKYNSSIGYIAPGYLADEYGIAIDNT